MYQLRPYQQDAVDAAIAWMRRTTERGLLELATGAGKSLIVAEIARWVNQSHGKRVLCLQPTAELTTQNAEKYKATGEPCSIFSASAGGKSTRHPVIFGTPVTVKNSIARFGNEYGAIIIDEAHGITPTIREIIDAITTRNPRVRVIGMTATPYRMLEGYIYGEDENGKPQGIQDEEAQPYFKRLLYSIRTRELIDMGYLTPAHSEVSDKRYNASGLELNSRGQFESSEVKDVFENQTLTTEIVADIMRIAQDRRGVMLFAATVLHAHEILAALPQGESAIVTGDTPASERKEIIGRFKAQRIKYIVNVSVLTTGFDAPHVDLIAVLRATESPGLFQQIIGRGLRLFDGKDDCLVLDFAGNIERHGLEHDLFSPVIQATKKKSGSETREFFCETCGASNIFKVNPDHAEVPHDHAGDIVDSNGERITVSAIVDDEGNSEHRPIPVHYGRRCFAHTHANKQTGKLERCEGRWSSKKCPHCGADNDMSARMCCKCKGQIVDPNDKLDRDFFKVKRNPYQPVTAKVLNWSHKNAVSQSGNPMYVVSWVTSEASFTSYFLPESDKKPLVRKWNDFLNAVGDPENETGQYTMPQTVTYRKPPTSDFYEIMAYNLPEVE